MDKIHLKIITPKKKVLDEDVLSVSAPSQEGEITILPRHTNLFSLLIEGVIKIRREKEEVFLSIGGGYLQTNGQDINILVSRAYGQNEIDEQLTTQAIEDAKNVLRGSKDESERAQAAAVIRHSLFDLKALRKHRKTRSAI